LGAPVNLVIKPPAGLSPKKRFQSLYLVPRQKAREAIDEQRRARIIKKQDLEKRQRQAKSQAESQTNRQEINRLLAIENARSGLGTIRGSQQQRERGLFITDVEEQRRLKPILPARESRIGTGAFKQSVVIEGSGMPKMPRKVDDKSSLAGIITATAPPTTTLTSSGKSVRATGLGTLPMGTKPKQTEFPSPRGSLPRGFSPQRQPEVETTPTMPQQKTTQEPSTMKEKVKKDKAKMKKEAKQRKPKLSDEEILEKRRFEAEVEAKDLFLKEEKRITSLQQQQLERDKEKILVDEKIAQRNVEESQTELGTDAGSINRLLIKKGGIDFL